MSKNATSATALFRTDRTASYGNNELTVWRRHVAKENLAEMNLLCNRLAAQGAWEEDMSFLRSSAGNQGGWEQVRTQLYARKPPHELVQKPRT